jgi:hypothetical protein
VVRGLEAFGKAHSRADQRWNEHPHELAEHVAKRQHLQEPQRVKDALVAAVLRHLALDGIHAGQNVAVREHYAARIGRCPGGKDDLGRVVAGEGRGRVHVSRVRSESVIQILKLEMRDSVGVRR